MWNAHGSLSINGSPVSITPGITLNTNGTTTVVYDIGAVAPLITAGSAISLSYTADIQPSYIDTGLPVLASDNMSNTVNAVYNLVQGATACEEGSGASVSIIPVSLTKSIINPQSFYVPGEIVTFRLVLDVPSGDTRNIFISDALAVTGF